MKKRNAAYVVVLSLIAAAFTTNTLAEDVSAGFMGHCTKRNIDPACCGLLIKEYSDSYRDMVKRDLPELEKSTKKDLTIILAKPGMTKEKIDAVCGLFDSSEEHSWMARFAGGAGDRKGYKEHRNQSNQLNRQFRELAQSYNTETLNGNDIELYCRDRNKVNQIKKDLEEDDGNLYPHVKRELKSNSPRVYNNIFGLTRHVKCPKKGP